MSVESYLCEFCKHFDMKKELRSLAAGKGHVCAAYPDGMPDEIFDGREKHFTPRPDDNGLHFEMIDPEDIGFLRRYFGYPW